MSIAIKVAKPGKNADGRYDDLVFDTQSPSVMCSQAYQINIPEDPDWNNTLSYYEKTIVHNLGYVPLIISNWSLDGGLHWYMGYTGMAYNKNNISIFQYRTYTYNLILYVLAVDVEKEFKSKNIQNFTTFDSDKIEYGIEVQSNGKETFNTKYKKMPLNLVKPNIIPTDEGLSYKYTLKHDYSSPVLYDLIGNIADDQFWTPDNRFIGMWHQIPRVFGSYIFSDFDNIYFYDFNDPSLYTKLSSVIYGKLK